MSWFKERLVYIDAAGQTVLKVNVPAFKFERAKEDNQMQEVAFEYSEKTFEDKLYNPNRSKVDQSKEDLKIPSLLKGDSSRV